MVGRWGSHGSSQLWPGILGHIYIVIFNPTLTPVWHTSRHSVSPSRFLSCSLEVVCGSRNLLVGVLVGGWTGLVLVSLSSSLVKMCPHSGAEECITHRCEVTDGRQSADWSNAVIFILHHAETFRSCDPQVMWLWLLPSLNVWKSQNINSVSWRVENIWKFFPWDHICPLQAGGTRMCLWTLCRHIWTGEQISTQLRSSFHPLSVCLLALVSPHGLSLCFSGSCFFSTVLPFFARRWRPGRNTPLPGWYFFRALNQTLIFLYLPHSDK